MRLAFSTPPTISNAHSKKKITSEAYKNVNKMDITFHIGFQRHEVLCFFTEMVCF